MTGLKSTFLFFLLTFALISRGQNPDTLLKRAKVIYPTNAAQGIKLTRQAYDVATKQNLKPKQVIALTMLSVRLWDSRDNKAARAAAKLGLALAIKLGVDSLTGDLWVTAGLIDYTDGLNKAAIDKYQRGLTCFQKGGNKKKIGITYVNLGICQKRLSNFEQANDCYFKAAAVFLNLNDKENLCGAYNSIGNCFFALKKTRQAIVYYTRAFILSIGLKDVETQAQCLNNLGYGYKEINQPDSAIKYLTGCIKLRNVAKDSDELVLPLQNLGSVWKQKGDIEKALQYINRSIKIAGDYHMQEELARGYLDQAEAYLQQHQTKEALTSIAKSYRLVIVLKSRELQGQVYGLRAAAAEQQGNYREALAYQKKHKSISDSLFNINQQKVVEEIATRYDVKQKDLDIAALHTKAKLEQQVMAKQRAFIIALIIAVALAVLAGLTVYRSYRQKQSDHRHIQYLMKELHHRVKNNLQMLSGLFSLQLADTHDEQVRNSIRENELRINSMNIIHQKLYDSETAASLNIREYIDDLVRYIQISYGTASKKIDFKVAVEPLLVSTDKVVAIGLIINELITNACKYAFGPDGGSIWISFKLEGEKQFVLTVADDGVGKKSTGNPAENNSFGTRLVEIMARQLNAKLTLTEGSGLQYSFEIPD